MKKFTLFVAGIIITLIPAFAQQFEPCITEILFQEKAKLDPSLLQNREMLERETEKYVNNNPQQKITGVVKTIPVVFHVIHEGGTENISKAQLLNQLDIMNADYRRLNADTVDTPVPFKPLAADANIEFRLAQLDPVGNCTDGITRTFSHLTNNARDNVKALIYWPSNKYLNIWVVKTIENTSGTPGIILGYAQFPGGGSLTDGIVLKSDYVGSIGTAVGSGFNGRTATHEAGHWFNLRHIWGDATCGSDLVADTPVQNVNFSTCPNFPKIDAACGNAPNGAMFTDYMDYTLGNCENMFSNGQSIRMNAALSSPVSGRNNLWTTANLIATGTDGTPPVICTPIADFNSETKMICQGTTLSFVDGSWNGDPVTWDWQFPGGTPGNSTSQNPSIQYNTPGIWDVTLTVTNSAGTDAKTATGMIIVSSTGAAIFSYPFNEGFEGGSIPNDWFVNNENPNTNTWEQTTTAAHTGSNSVRIYNYSGNVNGIDAFITTSFNLSYVTQTKMIFWRAFAHRSSATTDQLKVYSSTSCGQLWSLRYTKSGTALSTAGLLSSVFIPNASQWDADTVNLSSTSVSTRPNVRFKFEYIQDTGNNIYLDDINLDGIVGVNENIADNFNFNIIPNPAIVKAQITFTLETVNDVSISIHDITGRVVQQMNEKNLLPDTYVYDVTDNLQNGVYFVRLTVGNFSTVKKLVLQ
ncbi:MAG: PKD domain-containing protein [Bacteroidia bacterium]